MRIGVNILYLIPGEVGGTETYARNLIPALVGELTKGDELIVFASQETASSFKRTPRIKVVTLPFYAKNRFARIFFEQMLLPIYCLRYKIGILFSLGYSQPIFLPCRSIVTIHDLNWYYHPEDFATANRIFWSILTRLSAKSADHIITDSKFSLESIMSVLKIEPSKITSILHATPPTIKEGISKIKRPYLFSVLAGYPHKNLITLVKVFKNLNLEFPKLKLVVAGLSGRADNEVKDYISRNRLTNKIKILGYIENKELASIYSRAAVFVFPSAYEGFGYPVLEAMSYGIPVVSSGAASLTEVVGNGGILVHPYAIEEYLTAIKSLLVSDKQKQKYVKNGTKRCRELDWSKTAQTTFQLIKKIVSQGAR